MSGEKRTPLRIAQDDIRMLERQMRRMRDNHADALREARKSSEEEINKLRRRNEEKENAMNQRMNNMSADFRQMRLRHDEEMKKQSREFYDAQQRQSKEFNRTQRAVYNQLSQSIQETNQYVDSIRRSHEQQLRQMKSQLNTLMSRQMQNQQSAHQLINDLKCEIAIAQSMPYQKFQPQGMRQILSHIQGITQLPAESQMSIAHTAIKDLLILEEQIEAARLRYEATHLQIIQAIDTLLNDIRENQRNLYMEGDEGRDSQPIDIDFWTEGQYSALESMLVNLRANLTDSFQEPAFTQEALEEVGNIVEEMEKQQEALVHEAVAKANSSGMRASIAEKIAEILHDSHCYEVVDYGYEQQDQRKSFLAKLHSTDNDSDIVVLIYPESANEQQLILKTKTNGYISEKDLYTRASEINNELKAAGIQINDAPCEVNPGNEHSLDGLYDIAAILHEQGEGLPQQVIRNAGLGKEQENNRQMFN